MNLPTTTTNRQADLPRAGQVVLLTGAAGFFFANFAVQFLSSHFGMEPAASITRAGIAWATSCYTLASLAGATLAQPIEQRLGKRPYFVGGAMLLATFGWLQAMAPCEPTLLAMRTFEGFVSGGFGPRALLAAFVLCRTGRLPTVAAVAAFFLLIAGIVGLVMYGVSESLLGRHGIFLVQFTVGLVMAFAGLRWLPRTTRAASGEPLRPHPITTNPRASLSRRRRRVQGRRTTWASRTRVA